MGGTGGPSACGGDSEEGEEGEAGVEEDVVGAGVEAARP